MAPGANAQLTSLCAPPKCGMQMTSWWPAALLQDASPSSAPTLMSARMTTVQRHMAAALARLIIQFVHILLGQAIGADLAW